MEIHIGKRIKKIALYTLFFMIVMHGSRYFSLSFSHDALAFSSASDIEWKISLGRYMQPVYWMVRGQIAAPYIVGMLSYVWLTLAVYLVTDILKIQSSTAAFLCTGVMTGSISLVASNIGYIHESDAFMLALFLCVFAAWICLKRVRGGWILVPVLLAASAGIYQAYLQVYVVLVMIWAVKQILTRAEEPVMKKTLLSCVKSAVLLMIGVAGYYVVWRCILVLTGIRPASGYNGMTQIGHYEGEVISELLIGTWAYPFEYLLNLKGKSYWAALLPRIVIAAYALCATIYVLVKKRCGAMDIAVVCAIVLLLPAGMNCMYIISKGLIHDLIVYAYCFADIYAIAVTEYAFGMLSESRKRGRFERLGKCVMYGFMLMFCITFFDRSLYANQGYLKKELEYDSTYSVMTRIIDRLEQLDGYEINQTPVIICGRFVGSPLSLDNKTYADVQKVGGFWGNYSMTFEDTYWWYLRDVMGYPIVKYEDQWTIPELPEVRAMPAFPHKGSVAMLDGIAIVKISN